MRKTIIKQQGTGYYTFNNGILRDHQKSRFRRVFTTMGKCSQYIFSEKADLQNTMHIIIPLYPYVSIYVYICKIYTHIYIKYVCFILLIFGF